MIAVPSGVLYDGLSGEALAAALDVPRVVVAGDVDSTMDIAHALAEEGGASGTVVLAESQRRGRGRSGKEWTSGAGRGVWMTLLERPTDQGALDVLSLRVGLRVARVLDRFVPTPVALKWPNDLLLDGRKLAGILVETRWRGGRAEWVAIGIGVNVGEPPAVAGATTLGSVARVDVLGELVPAMRAASAARGALTPGEVEAFAARDWARGRRALSPAAGVVCGITASGALLVQGEDTLHHCASGSLILEGPES